MLSWSRVVVFVGISLTCVVATADTLELKNGKVIKGRYLGGTSNTVRFQTSKGTQVIETGKVLALTFTGKGAPVPSGQSAPSAPAVQATATPEQQAGSVTIPAGTTLLVRMNDTVSSRSGTGSRFSATLEYDISVKDKVAVKGGTKVYGKVVQARRSRRAVGQSKLDIRLNEIVVGGKPVPIATGPYAAAGERSVKKAARGAAAGAAIGAIAGDPGMGAAIGATAGAARRGQDVGVKAGSLIEFQLSQPVTVQTK